MILNYTRKGKLKQPSAPNQSPQVAITQARTITLFLWLLFLANAGLLLYHFWETPSLTWEGIVHINGFTLLMWTTVTLFSALISQYSIKYLNGYRQHNRFMWLCLGFTLSVMLLVASEHLILFLLAWLVMGLFMAGLIGVDAGQAEAREAARFALKYFLAGSFFLSAGILLLVFQTSEFTQGNMILAIENVPMPIVTLSVVCIIVSAIIQSAMYPFHRWLLSAMTAPTPASALMHAGFVNGAGILLALLSPLLFASDTLTLLFVIGGLTAIIAQFTKLLQTTVKQKLACSTIAQMGFMIMQCGLGFFTAAITHLILHGFYKAYLFLSSGEGIRPTAPQNPLKINIKPLQALAVLFFGILGALLFSRLTGKGMAADSGIFLILIVAITVGQVTYNIVKQQSLSLLQKTLLLPMIFLLGIGLYALVFNGVGHLMADMPMVAVPMPISAVQVFFGLIFLIGFFIMKLGLYRKVPRLYVKLMNVSQPYKNSILMYKSKS